MGNMLDYDRELHRGDGGGKKGMRDEAAREGGVKNVGQKCLLGTHCSCVYL